MYIVYVHLYINKIEQFYKLCRKYSDNSYHQITWIEFDAAHSRYSITVLQQSCGMVTVINKAENLDEDKLITCTLIWRTIDVDSRTLLFLQPSLLVITNTMSLLVPDASYLSSTDTTTSNDLLQ